MRLVLLGITLALPASGFVTACGNPAPPKATVQTADARTSSANDRYLPLGVGAKWTYHSVDTASGAGGDTESVVEAYEDVGATKAGVLAFRVKSTTLKGSTVNWQQDLGTSVVRHREQFFDLAGLQQSEYVFTPYRLRLDEGPDHVVQGATWTESHTANIDKLIAGTKQTGSFTVSWTVEAVDEMVVVPAGTFRCLRVHRVESGFAASNVTQWFARRVGKVKESGPVNEELTSYALP